MGFHDFLMLLSVLAITGCGTTEAAGNSSTASNGNETVTDSTLVVLVDARYKMSHGWGHVFSCKVKDVIRGNLEDSAFSLSVYGTIKLYGDLLLPFKEYHDLILTFTLNPERSFGPPPGFKDSRGNYWEMKSAMQAKDSSVSLFPNTIYEYFPDLSGSDYAIAAYAYDSFPPLRYSKPRPEEWSKGLKKIAGSDLNMEFVRIWRKESRIEYIWITKPYPDGGEFYAFDNDTVDALYPVNSQGFLFVTEVGIVNWRYIYNKGLLSKIAYYRTNTLSPIWAVDSVEYWTGTDVPKYTYRYTAPDGQNIPEKKWDSRTIYDKEGKITRKEDFKGNVLWERESH